MRSLEAGRRPRRSRVARPIAGVLVGTMAGVAMSLGGVASAHVEPDPGYVVQGTSGAVSFAIPHGCGSAGTTELAFEVPAGVTAATITPPAGWITEPVTGQLVVGGPEISGKEEFAVVVRFRAPARTGKLRWRVVQSCTTGVNRWIEVPGRGNREPEYPAPVVKVVTKAKARHLAARAESQATSTHA